MADNEFTLPTAPPPPLFLNKKEKDFVKQVNDEVIERVIGQRLLYYPIDFERTDYHPVYGEAIVKNFLNPVHVLALVEWGGLETQTEAFVDATSKITVHFHRRRLTEEQDLYVRVGDFVLFDNHYYEIVKLTEPKMLFGQNESRFEITAECIRARDGLFDGT